MWPKWFIILLLCVSAICLGWAGYAVYRIQRHQMYLRNGRQALERADFLSALAFAKRAIEDHGEEIGACRLMGDVEDALVSPSALQWRLRLTHLESANVSNYLSWAETALKLGNAQLALKALNSAPKERTDRADWNDILGKTELALGQVGAAEASFSNAVQLAPTNSAYKVDLNSAWLQSGDPSREAQALAQLDEATRSGTGDISAVRVLLTDALNRNDLGRARVYGGEIETRQDATFDDTLLALDARFRAGTADAVIEKMKLRAAARPREAVAFAYWLIGHGHASDAAAWLRDRYQLSSAPVDLQMANADALIAVGNWSEIESELSGQRWEDNEYLRLASIARALRAREAPEFTATWDLARKAARADQASTFRLGVIVLSWGWKKEACDLFWRSADTAPAWRSQALWLLWQIALSERDTSGLLRVASNQYKDEPEDIRYKNNCAFYLLLLNLDLTRARHLAEECWRQSPVQANVASTYAFALYRAEQFETGVQVLQRLSEQELIRPNIALYYALLLNAAGQKDKARHYLGFVQKTDRLLPEEFELVDHLTNELDLNK